MGLLRWVCSGGPGACPNLSRSTDSVTVGKEECSQHEGLPAQETRYFQLLIQLVARLGKAQDQKFLESQETISPENTEE